MNQFRSTVGNVIYPLTRIGYMDDPAIGPLVTLDQRYKTLHALVQTPTASVFTFLWSDNGIDYYDGTSTPTLPGVVTLSSSPIQGQFVSILVDDIPGGHVPYTISVFAK